ncbi:MAG: DUF1501 domain-containing protein [Pseudomonadota bacterium]
MQRRDFLRLSSLAGVSCLSVGPQAARATQLPGGEYKAIVLVMLRGGNDAFNMLIPNGSDRYADYAASRSSLAVANTPLSLPEPTLTAGANPYRVEGDTSLASAYRTGLYEVPDAPLAVNGLMPELAMMLGEGRAKGVLGTGNLVRPVSRQEVLDEVAELPLFLFAHNHQRRQIELGGADLLTGGPGWAGRLADRWFGGYDERLPLGLNIAFGGFNQALVGELTSPLVLRASGPTNFNPFAIEGAIDSNTDRLHANRRALYQWLTGDAQAPAFADALPAPQDYREAPRAPTSNLFAQAYQRFAGRSQRVLEQLNADWERTVDSIRYQTTDRYGEALFAVPTPDMLNLDVGGSFGDFIGQMEAIATMVKLGADAGYQRHIFLAELGGFDTHSGQADRHPALLRELSLGLDKFDRAVTDLGLGDNVLALTLSDFGRTVSNNGDGTDHGWATHQLVLGGGMRAGGLLGTAPSLTLGGDDDYSDKGRIIPTLANDQLLATALDWFGVSREEMTTVLPNLTRFASDPADWRSALLNELLS